MAPSASNTQFENRKGSLDKPKIPDVCDAMGVRWLTLPEFVDEQDWTASFG